MDASDTIGDPGRADTLGDEPLLPLAINEIKTNRRRHTGLYRVVQSFRNRNRLSGATLTDSVGEKNTPRRGHEVDRGRNCCGDGNSTASSSQPIGARSGCSTPRATACSTRCITDRSRTATRLAAPRRQRAVDHFAEPTLGQANTAPFQHTVVINEIMYNPVSLDDNDEYVELHNHGDEPVDLSNWQFNDGITFIFPYPTTLPAGGYIVVAKIVNNSAKHKGLTPSS